MRIQPLPPDVVTKIAAGEVIERPASVVKELLENAVDAGSTRIDVEVEQGGAELIRVVDNGCGILPDDLPLAFASHATSKLRSADDLFRITTLGFRGEALASIGSVAQVKLQSRAQGADRGAEITCHGGDVGDVRAWNGAAGTRLEVRHLFYNTPVRRKFLRTTSTELGHVCEVFTRLALAQPTLHLTLRHQGRDVYEVSGSHGLLERLGLFFGAEVRDALYPVDAQDGVARLHGYIADPACERGNARQQYLFLNGRWIRDRSLGHALQEAYRGLLMTGRYAVAFLFLEMPPDQVDVNVHPTKVEVRFRQGSSIYQLVLRAIRERLHQADLTARWRVSTAAIGGASDPWSSPGASTAPTTPWLPGNRSAEVPPPLGPIPARENHPSAPNSAPPPPPGATPVGGFVEAHGKAIQLYDSYLVLETPEGMLVIDQHALHERILFEQFKRRLREGPLETQPLLIPEVIELPAEQTARALEHRAALRELGLEVDYFGGGSVLLSSYPAILGNRSPQGVLRAVVDHLVSKDRVPEREQMLNDLLSLMACHSAVRAGDRLTPEEIAALVAQRHLANDTHHCPHGRPTSLLLSRQDLERQFRRI